MAASESSYAMLPKKKGAKMQAKFRLMKAQEGALVRDRRTRVGEGPESAGRRERGNAFEKKIAGRC